MCMCGVCVVYVWCMYGVCVVYVWEYVGVCVGVWWVYGVVWCMCGCMCGWVCGGCGVVGVVWYCVVWFYSMASCDTYTYEGHRWQMQGQNHDIKFRLDLGV